MLLKTQHIIAHLSSFLIVLLFVYTGFSKLLANDFFLQQLMNAGFLKVIAKPVSIILPLIEIFTAMLITIKQTEIFVWLGAALLMTVFSIYIGTMLLLKSTLPCTCGGVLAALSWQQHLLLNIFFMAFSLGQFMHEYKKRNY